MRKEMCFCDLCGKIIEGKPILPHCYLFDVLFNIKYDDRLCDLCDDCREEFTSLVSKQIGKKELLLKIIACDNPDCKNREGNICELQENISTWGHWQVPKDCKLNNKKECLEKSSYTDGNGNTHEFLVETISNKIQNPNKSDIGKTHFDPAIQELFLDQIKGIRKEKPKISPKFDDKGNIQSVAIEKNNDINYCYNNVCIHTDTNNRCNHVDCKNVNKKSKVVSEELKIDDYEKE